MGNMKNIFLFIRRYFNFILFLVLQIISIAFLVSYNKTHEAAYANFANELTGSINQQYNKVQYYFDLKKTNQQLVNENNRLRNLLPSNFDEPDTTRTAATPSIQDKNDG